MTVDSSPVKFTPALLGQPVPDIRTMSGGDRPVFRAELPDGRIVWLVTGYEAVRQMIIDQRFSRALAVAPGRAQPGFEMSAAGSINGMDPPEHTRLRKLVASAFTARRVEALRPRVAGIVNELIDAMAGRPQPADLVAGFSLPLPAQVICEMGGTMCAFTSIGGHGGLPSSGAGSRIGLRCPGLGSARGWTDRDGDGRFSRAWRGDLEGDAGRPGDDDAAGEAGEARPAYRQPDRVPRSREESLA
jgi:hypothetical protein